MSNEKCNNPSVICYANATSLYTREACWEFLHPKTRWVENHPPCWKLLRLDVALDLGHAGELVVGVAGHHDQSGSLTDTEIGGQLGVLLSQQLDVADARLIQQSGGNLTVGQVAVVNR